MASHLSGSSLQALVGKGTEAEPDAVVGRRLAGVPHPPFNVVEAQELPLLRFWALGLINMGLP